MNLQDCILTRRSVRKFTQQPVQHETLAQIVSLAAFAPSWNNTQVSRYLVIENAEKLDKIAHTYAPQNADILHSCPILVAQTFIKGYSGFEQDGSYATDRAGGWQYYDCGLAAQTFCLAAHDLGLGTVVIGRFDRKGLERYLNIPQNQELMALIALGYPDEHPSAPRRQDVQSLLSYEDVLADNHMEMLRAGRLYAQQNRCL